METALFRDTRGTLIESIWWDARTAEVVWVDITAGTLHRGPLDGPVDGSDDRVVHLPPPLSAVQPAAGDGYVAALKNSVVLLDAEGRIQRELARVMHAHDGIRMNEGKVDPFGRFIVGSMDVTRGDPDGALYAFHADGTVHTLRGGFAVANGFEWSRDGTLMYVTDTATKIVYRASYGARGELGELVPHLVGRSSDGLARAVDGTFWNGIYGDGCVVRWGVDGEPRSEHVIPAPNVTSVAFVGPDLDVLLIGTARENLTEDDLACHPRSGAIFRMDDGSRGRPVHTFADPTSSKEN